MTVNLEAIWAIGLEKSYGDARVLDGVDLRIPSGTIYALLGPNGAGKTTTVRILSTLLEPDAGQAFVAGFDVIRDRTEVRRRISLVSQDVALDELQTGRENLRMVGQLGGLPRSGRPATRRRAARDVRSRRRRRPARRDVLGRHAAASRCRSEPDGDTAGAVPRRADDGARPA